MNIETRKMIKKWCGLTFEPAKHKTLKNWHNGSRRWLRSMSRAEKVKTLETMRALITKRAEEKEVAENV